MWKHPWRDLAWCEVNDYGVLLHLYRNDPQAKGTLLTVDDPDQTYEIYELVGVCFVCVVVCVCV